METLGTIVAMLFVLAVLLVLPGWLIYAFGGLPCLAVFLGAKLLDVIASNALKT